jgi:hypothetical protein
MARCESRAALAAAETAGTITGRFSLQTFSF